MSITRQQCQSHERTSRETSNLPPTAVTRPVSAARASDRAAPWASFSWLNITTTESRASGMVRRKLRKPRKAPPWQVAASPAIWSDPGAASSAGFDDEAEYEQYSVVGHQDDLDGIPVRVDVGTGDPFYRDVQDYVESFPDSADVTSTFEPGAHDPAYWRRMLPDELAFLGAAVGSRA